MFASGRKLTWFLCILAGLVLLVTAAGGAASDNIVAVIKIDGIIDSGTRSYIAYALDQARKMDVAAVILELDTPGGYINAAEEIRRLMDDFPRPIYAYINTNAISGGAYLALAADAIYMAPGSTFGAAEPRYLGLGEVDEKMLSYWEKEMSAMAERRGRDPQVAAAMVRKDLAVEGLVEAGVLLTLTAGEALEVGYSEGTASDREELLRQVNLGEANWQLIEKRVGDRLVGWTTNPVIGTILLMIGIVGLIIEVISSGFGIAGILSMAAFALYFGGNIAAGMAEYWVILLFVFGIALMLVEAFMPGFGVFGVSGLISTIIAIILAAVSIKTGMLMLVISLVLAVAVSYFAFRLFEKRGALRHIILSEEERADQGYVAPLDQRDLLGQKGVALTALRPSGTALINDRRVDVISEGAYISQGTALIVEQVEGVRVIVSQIEPDRV